MADMTIVIEAVDKATAEIAKIKTSVAAMEKNVAAAAKGTETATKQTATAMQGLGKEAKGAADVFGKFAAGWKIVARVMASSAFINEATQGFQKLSDAGLTATASALGLGDAVRGLAAYGSLAQLSTDLAAVQSAIAKIGTGAAPSQAIAEQRLAKIESLISAERAIQERIAKIQQWQQAGLTPEQGERVEALGKKRADSQKAFNEALAKSNEELRETVEIVDSVAAASIKTPQWVKDLVAISKTAVAAVRPLYDAAQAVATAEQRVIDLEGFRRSVAPGQLMPSGFEGVDRQDLLRALSNEIAKAKQELFQLRAEQTLVSLGFAGIAHSVASTLTPAMAAADPVVDALRASLNAAADTDTEVEQLGVAVITTSQRLAELVTVAELLGDSALPSLRDAIFELRIREAAEEWAELRIGVGATEDQIQHIADSMRALRPQVETLTESFRDYSITLDDIAGSVANNFADAFMSMIDGTKSFKEAFGEMVVAILRDVIRMIIVKSIMTAIMPGASAGGSGGGIFGLGLLGLQHGGTVRAGAPILVGERGPELFVPHQSGYVNNASATAGGGPVSVTFNINAVDGPSVAAMLRRERDTIKAVIASAVTTDTRFRASLN